MPTPFIVATEPGLTYFVKENVSTWMTVCTDGPCQVYAFTFRNASTSPVFVNFYGENNVKVGGVGATNASMRVLVPGALDASNPGQVYVTADNFPLRSFKSGLSIAPVLTDTNGAVVGGTLSYAEIQWAIASVQ